MMRKIAGALLAAVTLFPGIVAAQDDRPGGQDDRRPPRGDVRPMRPNGERGRADANTPANAPRQMSASSPDERAARGSENGRFDQGRSDRAQRPEPTDAAAQGWRGQRVDGGRGDIAQRRDDRARAAAPSETPQGDGRGGFGDRGGGRPAERGGYAGRADGATNDRDRFGAQAPDRRDGRGEYGRHASGRADRGGDGGFGASAQRGGRDGYGGGIGGGRDWNRGWRGDGRYDWSRYRQQSRGSFRLPRYYAPGGWDSGYRRFQIGFTLRSALWAQDYWIDDPYAFRLPPAYGPYRWVRYYNDALLVDIRSGYVVDTVYDIFW